MLPKASVVPAVVAPSSPCMASCGTPQSPCNLFAYSNDWAWARLHSAGEVLSLFGCLCQSFLLLSFYVALHKDWTCVEKLSLMHELDAVVQLLWANSRQISPVCEPTGADHSNAFCVHLVLLTFNWWSIIMFKLLCAVCSEFWGVLSMLHSLISFGKTRPLFSAVNTAKNWDVWPVTTFAAEKCRVPAIPPHETKPDGDATFLCVFFWFCFLNRSGHIRTYRLLSLRLSQFGHISVLVDNPTV